jgi:hypothetical protein
MNQPQTPQRVRFTTWHNPTDKDAILDMQNDTGAFERHVVPAMGDAIIPAVYDVAVQKVRNGVIVGGKGPRLIRKGDGPAPVLHSALDPEKIAEAEAEKKLSALVELKDVADKLTSSVGAKQAAKK